MARRRRDEKKEEEDEVFKIPEFDEKEYIEKEIEKSKASVGILSLAVLFALISSFVFYISLSWPLSALVGLLGLALFKFTYPLFKVNSSVLEKKDYAGHVFLYLFTWLAIFILLINTPFADFTSPSISDIHIEVSENGSDWINYNGSGQYNYSRIVAIVTDNSGISSVEIKTPGNSTWKEMKKDPDSTYIFNLNSQPSKGELYEIRAIDVHGHERIEYFRTP